MDISILIPVYNVEAYVGQCLKSIPHNSLEMEIVCLNDGSSDKSLTVLELAAREDERIVIIDKQNEGYGATLNCGMREAQGRYIGIVEPDDFLDGDMFATLFNLAKRLDFPDVVKSAYWSASETDDVDRHLCGFHNRIQATKQPFCIEDEPLLLRYHPSIWSAIYRKDFLDENHIYFREVPGAGWVDNPFMVDTLCQADSIAYTNEAFYCYREERTASSTNCIADYRMPLDRWIEMTQALRRIGVTDRRIWGIHAYRCLYNLNIARHAANYPRNKAHWRRYAKYMLGQIPFTCFVRALQYVK
ncbi:glycosyltransferase family 2 protein [Gordonibacter pamelaeae]|uniref:Glycosyltransferases involved in cell wall biogenesis n=1 Tax=Gordonibacter pamelaeae 7-10-1-b TaxID=657308 RepID=D6E689_9ACTN|nr:glycosyltransferase [Gordonibacter pamelaeae]CBL03236.1 Glycosyltransferases involved in cell wall biogenesis [Gordonibacter pamelaeae 7-10-1-b]